MRQEIHRMTNNLLNPAYSDEWEQIQDDLRLHIGLYRKLNYDLDEEIVASAEYALANPKDPHGPEVRANFRRSSLFYIECVEDGIFDNSLGNEIRRLSDLKADETQPEFKRESVQLMLNALENRRRAITESPAGA